MTAMIFTAKCGICKREIKIYAPDFKIWPCQCQRRKDEATVKGLAGIVGALSSFVFGKKEPAPNPRDKEVVPNTHTGKLMADYHDFGRQV